MTTAAAALSGLLVGIAVGLAARRWTDTQAGRPTPAWVHVALAGVLCAAAGWRFGLTWELPAYLYFAAISGPLAIVDLRAYRLPNAITLSAYPIVAVLLAVALLDGGHDGAPLRALLAGLVVLAFYAVLHLVNPAGMGLGDVKLAGPMGALLGWLSWSVVLVGGFLGFALGAVVGIGLLLARRAGRKSALPFGPFMLAGAWLAIWASGPIGDWGVLP